MTNIDPIFLEQAQAIVKGGECLPSIEALAKRLQTAADKRQPLTIKLGLDPTRPDLHLGHAVVLKKMRLFQDLGHKAVLLIGDATALIGDPSGKNETRPPLTEAEVTANADTYMAQAGKVLDLDKATVVRNSEWFSGMHLGDFLKLAAKATIAQILERDDFSKRYNDGRPIYMHELFYPLMQGYDSVMLKSDVELGGSDQRFNNLMGRELQTAFAVAGGDADQEPQIVILAPILEGTDGVVKMSKSYPEHCINFTDEPFDFYGKLMSVPDELIGRYQLLLTPMTQAQIDQQAAAMASGKAHPRDVKAYMAKWLTQEYFTPEAADEAEQRFDSQIRRKEIPDDIPAVTVTAGSTINLLEFLHQHQLIPSKGEGKRLLAGGGIKQDGEKIPAGQTELTAPKAGESTVLQVGKRKFLKLIGE